MNRFEDLIKAEKVIFEAKNGDGIESVLSKVIDVNLSVEEVEKEKGIKNPKLVPFMDGSLDNCIVAAVILEKDEDEDGCVEKYRNTGFKRVPLLAKEAGVPETRENCEIIINSLNLSSLPDDIQIVCDLKLIGLLLGIQTASAMHGCPFCDSYKVNEHDNKVNTRRKYKEVDGTEIKMMI